MNKSEGKAAQETSVLIGCSENVYVEVQTCMSKYKLYFDVQIYTSKCILYLYVDVQLLYFDVHFSFYLVGLLDFQPKWYAIVCL